METPPHPRCHGCWNLQPHCTCPKPATSWLSVNTTESKPLTRAALEAAMERAEKQAPRPPIDWSKIRLLRSHDLAPEPKKGRTLDDAEAEFEANNTLTYEEAVAQAQWKFHALLQQQFRYGPDGIGFDYDPIAEAESFLR